jgi:hypothetical protein
MPLSCGDPQRDEDYHVQEVTATLTATITSAVDDFRDWAKAARGTAMRCQFTGDPYGEQLATARAEVYQQAADRTERSGESLHTAESLMHDAGLLVVRSAPLMDFDPNGIHYVQALAWQLCAHRIDPTVPEVQPHWD